MGLGSTAQKIQKLADTAETLYKQLQNVQERLIRVENTAMETGETVDELVDELDQQRAILEALAEAEGIDHEELAAQALIEEAEDAEAGVSDPQDEADAASDGGTASGSDGDSSERK